MLAELLIEIVFQLVFELFAEFGVTFARDAFGRKTRQHRAWAAVGIVVAGSAAGALAAWLVPQRILPRPPVPGLSLVVGPVVAGSAMHLLGMAEMRTGRAGSRLATFWGGALFAFFFSLTRLLLLPE